MSSLTAHISPTRQLQIGQKDDHFEIDGTSKSFDIAQISKNRYHIIIGHKSYNAALINADRETKTFQFKINGRNYDIKIEDQFDQLLQKLGMDVTMDKGFSELKAPMPGKVLSVAVSDGDAISEGDPLLILEAMKMENVLKSPADLTVKSICVTENQAVEKNELLIEFEP